MLLYFAYGSNMNPNQMYERIGREITPKLALLKNYELIFPRKSIIQKGGVASIIEKMGEVVYGVIYELNDNEMEKLDKYEGKGYAYDRININVLKDNEEISCETYIAKKEGDFLPSEEYLKKIITGAKINNLPSEYLEKLEKIETEDKI
jgi:gamma-glutamylcyclotransferase (GGCT)/AIG2-like uncharacterized protein YtfP